MSADGCLFGLLLVSPCCSCLSVSVSAHIIRKGRAQGKSGPDLELPALAQWLLLPALLEFCLNLLVLLMLASLNACSCRLKGRRTRQVGPGLGAAGPGAVAAAGCLLGLLL